MLPTAETAWLVTQRTHTIITYSSPFHNLTQTQDAQPNTFPMLPNQEFHHQPLPG
jgi:hypothetical protein